MCLTCVPSSWTIVTSFKSLPSFSLSYVLFTCHSHTMNSYYNCSQYVVIIQLVSLRLCKISFVLCEPFFWEYFSDFFWISLFVPDSSTIFYFSFSLVFFWIFRVFSPNFEYFQNFVIIFPNSIFLDSQYFSGFL